MITTTRIHMASVSPADAPADNDSVCVDAEDLAPFPVDLKFKYFTINHFHQLYHTCINMFDGDFVYV